MTLTEGNIGGVYLVTGMKLQESITRRLEALGMNEKTKLTILEKKKKGASIIRLRGTRLALGRPITDGILVIPPIRKGTNFRSRMEQRPEHIAAKQHQRRAGTYDQTKILLCTA